MGHRNTENHHPFPKEFQKNIFGKVIDERTIPLEGDLHRKITNQTRFEGVPLAHTVGEIDVDDLKKGRYPRHEEYVDRT